MKLSILAARDSAAQKRIIAAVTRLAGRFGVTADIRVVRTKTRDAQVKAMLQRERIAQLLEDLVKAEAPGGGITLDELAAVPGIGEATVAKVHGYLEARDG